MDLVAFVLSSASVEWVFSLLLRHLDRSEQITPDGERSVGGIKKSFSGNCKEKPAVSESATQRKAYLVF